MCDASFVNKYRLKKHIDTIHLGEPVKCSFKNCNKIAPNQSALVNKKNPTTTKLDTNSIRQFKPVEFFLDLPHEKCSRRTKIPVSFMLENIQSSCRSERSHRNTHWRKNVQMRLLSGGFHLAAKHV